MKKMKIFLSMAALALVGAMMIGCSSDDNEELQPQNTGKVVTLTTTVGFDDKAGTRALTSGGVKTFAAGDQIALIYTQNGGATVKAVSEALPTGTYGNSATFTFTLDDPDKTKEVKYIYPAAMAGETGVDYSKLSSQTGGTLTDLGSKYDLATYTHAWDGVNLPSATLTNELAILAITLKDDKATATTEDDDPITASVTRLTVSDGTNKYTATGCDADGHIYLAVLPTTSADITVDIYTAAHHYVKALADKKTYVASNLYPLGWKINQKAEPLTMEATTTGTIKVNRPQGGMQYSLNGGAKTTMTGNTTITVSVGDKVEFYGDGTNITSYYVEKERNGTSIAYGSAQVKVYGNIMSLLDETDFATATELTAKYTFFGLFNGNTVLTDASGLLLPATTLAYGCYEYMFWDCTSLTAAPALPATTLAEGCYYGMFCGCTSLTTAPVLPATTLANNCYDCMFSDCTSLKTAPALPAETLAEFCYGSMFARCTSLETAPTLPATTLAYGCYNSMFADCSSLKEAPALPAETLAGECYFGMFEGCTKLSAVTCLATDISADLCTDHWLSGAGTQAEGTKTFTTPSTTNWLHNANGIPSGWTRVNY